MATSPVGEVSEMPGEFVLQWKIKDFLSLSSKTDDFYKSPSFYFENSSWHLYIFPTGKTKTDSGGKTIEETEYLCLYLHRNSPGSPLSLNFTFGVKTIDEKIDYECKCTYTFTKCNRGYGNPRFLQRSTLLTKKSELMSSGDLTVICKIKYPKPADISTKSTENATCPHCKITLNAENIPSHEKSCLVECPTCSSDVILQKWYEHVYPGTSAKGKACASGTFPHEDKVLHDFKELFLMGEDCDVTINVQGREFAAHKAILKARSPVLAAAFRHNTKENLPRPLEVKDCDPSCFSDFLNFLYSGDISVISGLENVFKLFTVADKYEVMDLRSKCLDFIKNNLSVDTFCESLSLALLHSDNELIKLCTEFFISNAPKIIVTSKWKTFAAKNPTTSNELFVKLLVPGNSSEA